MDSLVNYDFGPYARARLDDAHRQAKPEPSRRWRRSSAGRLGSACGR